MAYEWKITFGKFIKQFALVAVIAGLIWAIDEGLAEIALEYPEYAALIGFITAALVGLVNWLKHRKDE